MSKSIAKPTHRVLAALKLHRLSVPKLALKHGVDDKTLYAALNETRPVNGTKLKRAVAEARRAEETLSHV